MTENALGSSRSARGARFSLRGEAKARVERNVVCLAVNLKRLHRLGLA